MLVYQRVKLLNQGVQHRELGIPEVCVFSFLPSIDEQFHWSLQKWTTLLRVIPYPDQLFWHSLHIICKYIWNMCSGILSDIISGICSDIISDILSGILPGIYSDIVSGILSDIHSGIYFDILSDILSRRLAEVRQCPLSSGARGWAGGGGGGGGRQHAALIKSRDPHLAGGEIESWTAT